MTDMINSVLDRVNSSDGKFKTLITNKVLQQITTVDLSSQLQIKSTRIKAKESLEIIYNLGTYNVNVMAKFLALKETILKYGNLDFSIATDLALYTDNQIKKEVKTSQIKINYICTIPVPITEDSAGLLQYLEVCNSEIQGLKQMQISLAGKETDN